MFVSLYFNPLTIPDNQGNNGQYFDFIISGKSLKEYLGLKRDSSVTPFGWFPDKSSQAEALKEFRCQVKPTLPGNRVSLYVCADCGDIGCGSVTVQILDKGDRIVWTKFANQSGPEDPEKFYDVEDLEFERINYFKAFSLIP